MRKHGNFWIGLILKVVVFSLSQHSLIPCRDDIPCTEDVAELNLVVFINADVWVDNNSSKKHALTLSQQFIIFPISHVTIARLKWHVSSFATCRLEQSERWRHSVFRVKALCSLQFNSISQIILSNCGAGWNLANWSDDLKCKIRDLGSGSWLESSRSQISDSRFQIPDSRFQIPDSRSRIPDPIFQVPGPRFQIPDLMTRMLQWGEQVDATTREKTSTMQLKWNLVIYLEIDSDFYHHQLHLLEPYLQAASAIFVSLSVSISPRVYRVQSCWTMS